MTVASPDLQSDQAFQGTGFRSLWGAGLINLLVQAAIALLPAMVIREAMILHLDEAREIGVAPIVRPELLTAGWFAELPIDFGWALACVLPGALLFVEIVARTGPGKTRSMLGWLFTGTISAIPLAIALCVLIAYTVHAPEGIVFYLIVGLVPCTIGACGAVASWHFRYGARWSHPA